MDTSERRPAQRLKLELRRHLDVSFFRSQAPWQAMMFFREMLEPTDVFDSLMNENMRPYQELIESLVREVVGPQTEEHVVRFSAYAAISLCNSFLTAQKYLKRLYSEEHFGGESYDELADLIDRFVIGGLRALKSSAK